MAEAVISPDDFSPNNIAASWWHGGCSVIPIRADGSKSPLFSWKQFQHEIPEKVLVKSWFEDRFPNAGVAVICGTVSGNLEMLELEGRANTPEIINQIWGRCTDQGIGSLWIILTEHGYSELTPSGGLHLLYRVADHPVPGNEKVASRPARVDEQTEQERYLQTRTPGWTPIRVLAETRGEGGYVIVAPTSGRCHPTGNGWQTISGNLGQFITITWEQRNQLHAAIRSLLHEPVTQDLALSPRSEPLPQRPPGSPLSVAEDFNARSSWDDQWFQEQGWRVHHREGDEVFWTRPGKDMGEGHSATTGYRQGEQDCLYVWSTSTSLPAEKPLTKFMVYAHYRYGGNMSAAARALQREGYGPAPLAPVEFSELDLGQGWEQGHDSDDPGRPDDDDNEEEKRQVQAHQMTALLSDLQGGIVLTDSGYALRMRDLYRDSLRYNSTDKCWYNWQSGLGVWIRDDYSFVDMAAFSVAQATFAWIKNFQDRNSGMASEKAIANLVKQAQGGLNHSRLQASVARFRTLEPIATTSDDFNGTLDLLNLRNGTLNLATFEVHPHTPVDMITFCCNASYDPEAQCNDFERYIAQVIPDEDLRYYVQRALGYSLLGRPVERAMFLLHGPSGTGKSVLTDIMTYIFGDYGVTAPSTTFKQKKQESTFDLHRIRGKRFVTLSEMPEGAQLDEELIKRVTGGDVIPSRGLYEKFQDWHAQCVVWIATNFLPKLSGDDNAIWRRVRTIPMSTEIGMSHGRTEIKGLGYLLRQEADGILNWVLHGLKEYRRLGLAEPDTVLTDIASYRTETDSVSSWLVYGIEDGVWSLETDERTLIGTAYSSYIQTCQENSINHLGKQRFTKRLSTVSSLQMQKIGGQWYVVGLRHLGTGLR